ncbi:MAG: hypothetical protein DRP06_02490 [Candidatus Aenigmatarchaeota archaeon]|nr:MAG: hypothetical protein DRP06_02490 [Candidatus Aenigmarchaeota archaeon]
MKTDELYQGACPFGGRPELIYVIGDNRTVYGRYTLASAILNLSNISDLTEDKLNDLKISMGYAGCPHPIKDKKEPITCKYAYKDWVEI